MGQEGRRRRGPHHEGGRQQPVLRETQPKVPLRPAPFPSGIIRSSPQESNVQGQSKIRTPLPLHLWATSLTCVPTFRNPFAFTRALYAADFPFHDDQDVSSLFI